MRNHFTAMYDEQKRTIDRLKEAFFEQERSDHEAVAIACAILAEHEIVSDQIALKYGR